jgi:hypothetical protein
VNKKLKQRNYILLKENIKINESWKDKILWID